MTNNTRTRPSRMCRKTPFSDGKELTWRTEGAKAYALDEPTAMRQEHKAVFALLLPIVATGTKKSVCYLCVFRRMGRGYGKRDLTGGGSRQKSSAKALLYSHHFALIPPQGCCSVSLLHATMRALAALTLVAAAVPLEAQFGMPPKQKSSPSKGASENSELCCKPSADLPSGCESR